jgi:glutathione S-transferase
MTNTPLTATTTPLVVHHLENSRSQRVLWLLEELGLPYTVKRYARDPVTLLAPPALAQVHPLGKSPVLTCTTTEGPQSIAESGAIIEFILGLAAAQTGHPALRPTDPASTQRFAYWLHFAEGSAMPLLVMKLVFDKVRAAPVPFFVKPVLKAVADNVGRSFLDPGISQQLRFMEAELAQRPWFAGDDFSAADIQMSYPVEAAAARVGLGDKHPKLTAWLARIHERPAYQRALATGGPYQPVP